jgi:cation diffusion facilitator family transporter
MTRLNKVRQVLLYTLFLNISVAAAKIIYGLSIGSISMLSDGIHSSADGTSNIIGLVGIWIASQPPDENHPYGHRKFETLSTIAIAVLIFGAGIEILRKSYDRLLSPAVIEVSYVSFMVMAITLMVNTGVMLYEAKKGRDLKSDFLIADSIHTKTDIFISISVVISLIAAKIGYPFIDIITALVITVFIAKMGFSILKSAAAVLTDSACISPDEIKNLISGIEGVRECHGIRTRGNEDQVNIDLHILINPDVTIQEAHEIAHIAEDALKKKFPSVIDVVIHIEPYQRDTVKSEK